MLYMFTKPISYYMHDRLAVLLVPALSNSGLALRNQSYRRRRRLLRRRCIRRRPFRRLHCSAVTLVRVAKVRVAYEFGGGDKLPRAPRIMRLPSAAVLPEPLPVPGGEGG